jgi:hypothetical protein
MKLPLAGALVLLGAATAALPPGYWPAERTGPILEQTQTLRLAPDLAGLTAGEAQAVAKLLQVGQLFQEVYEASRHHQARSALKALTALDRARGGSRETQDLLGLYRSNQGPIAITLENQREPFLRVDPVVPGKNVYPWGMAKDELEGYLAAHPDERTALLDARTVVRPATAASLSADLAALARHPVLHGLHPGLRSRLQGRRPGSGLYSVPYAVAYADAFVKAARLLWEAADAVEKDDEELARYLRNRGRDLLSNDYESGDASWVSGRFKRLNAQVGAYETYDDELMGVKAFHAVSVLLRNERESAELSSAIQGLQALEDSLPYGAHKKVREDIPVGVYDVIADFGQARGTNTATILPNDALMARRYGRTILLRANIMRHPDLFAETRAVWEAAVAPPFAGDLQADGGFYRTLWHEIGHYLGVDRDKQGRDLASALQENADLLEEMKSDLVSLFVARDLHARGYYDDARLKSLYAAGIRRSLNTVRPRREQPYQTMQLIQFNWFLERGVLSFSPGQGTLAVHYERYHDVVAALLKEALALQHGGDKAAADRFIDRYTRWEPGTHEALAARMRNAQRYRFRIVRYAALGE